MIELLTWAGVIYLAAIWFTLGLVAGLALGAAWHMAEDLEPGNVELDRNG